MNDDMIMCACGCGQPLKKAKFPSLQRRFINTHQHKGENNGNYKGGKIKCACAVCGTEFYDWESQPKKTCSDNCYREWQRMTTSARGINKIFVQCAHCGRKIKLFPSQVHEKNYCNKKCMAAGIPKYGLSNGRWKGGRESFFRRQTFIRDNYRCVVCGFDLAVSVHHITPRSEGGTNEFSNLITLCPNHHKLADLKIISLEHLRNFDWHPGYEVDTITPPASNR